MTDEKTTAKDDKPKNEAFEQVKKDTLTPEQKYKNYLETQEKLHNEP